MNSEESVKANISQTQKEISIFPQEPCEEEGNTNASSSQSKKDNLKSINLQIMNLSEDLENKPLQNPDDSLYTKIKNKLNKLDYEEDELIKDLKDLLDKNAFIEKFNAHTFIKKESFEIFDKLNPTKIYFNLNLLNYINIINAINYFTQKDKNKFPIILNKLGINFSWLEMEGMKDTVVVILLTPKTSVLYNYISTHGGVGIKNIEYKTKAIEFCNHSTKSSTDYGYCYEDFSVSYLSSILGRHSFKILPNVMYYIKDELGKKLKELNLVEIPKNYEIYKSPKVSLFQGFNETDFFILMLKTVEIQTNYNFKNIKVKNLKINKENNNIILEEKMIYIFEIKVSIDTIIKGMKGIVKDQKRFKYALQNVRIKNKCPFPNNFISILMCDNNPQLAQENVEKNVFLFRNKNLIYSGFQLGITYINQINNNIRDLHEEIDTLKGTNAIQNNKIKELELQNTKQKKQIKKLNEKIDNLEEQNSVLKEQNKCMNKRLDTLENELALIKKHLKIDDIVKEKNKLTLIKSNTKIDNAKLYELCLKLLENVFRDGSFSIYSLLKGENKSLLNKNTLEPVFKCFETIFEEMMKFCKPLLYSMVEYLLDEEVIINDILEVKDFLLEKILKDDACSPYYKAIKNLLFGIDAKNSYEIFKTLEQSKINYVLKLVGFVEIFDGCQNIQNIEMKLQGAILYIILNFFDNEKLNSLLDKVEDNDDNNRTFIMILISSINPNNTNLFY